MNGSQLKGYHFPVGEEMKGIGISAKMGKRRWRSGKNSKFEAHGAQTASSNPLIA